MAVSSIFEDDLLDLLFTNVAHMGVTAKEAADAFRKLGTSAEAMKEALIAPGPPKVETEEEGLDIIHELTQ